MVVGGWIPIFIGMETLGFGSYLHLKAFGYMIEGTGRLLRDMQGVKTWRREDWGRRGT
jgi:hypothetical protein